eukprot:TRINITY_DN21499_c0_g1_i1.p1 TRINITY_DN21499_c0_g1~~TRINITY_DN21499_c0_g1_i1.p1  ORF type:complete len:136 (-),score=22.93 TRINITY_DN21499_c0_g1_i1:18-380(-)
MAGAVVPGVGAAGDLCSTVQRYEGTKVYRETIETLMAEGTSRSAGNASVEQLRLAVENQMKGSIPGPWMNSQFLKAEELQGPLYTDFGLRMVQYTDNSRAFLCAEHVKEGEVAGKCKLVN